MQNLELFRFQKSLSYFQISEKKPVLFSLDYSLKIQIFVQVFLRNACRDGSLDLVARLQLLEIIELRAMKWKANDNVTNYYKTKMLQVEVRSGQWYHLSLLPGRFKFAHSEAT